MQGFDPTGPQQTNEHLIEVLDFVLPSERSRDCPMRTGHDPAEVDGKGMQRPAGKSPLDSSHHKTVAFGAFADNAESQMNHGEEDRLTHRLGESLEHGMEPRIGPDPEKIAIELNVPHRYLRVACSLYVLQACKSNPFRSALAAARSEAMCNNYRLIERVPAEELFEGLEAPEGLPNFEPRDDIRITDRAPIVRVGEAGVIELVQRRWSWPGPGGKPVYNFRSEGRAFRSGRCVILADGFYEFTAHSDPKSKRKHKWLFTLQGKSWFGIAGLWRNDPAVGEAFTMLTCPPAPDVAPYHNRSIVVLPPADCVRWLDGSAPESMLLQPLPAGSLAVEQVN